jgi:preprotein translocase subunit SecA
MALTEEEIKARIATIDELREKFKKLTDEELDEEIKKIQKELDNDKSNSTKSRV